MSTAQSSDEPSLTNRLQPDPAYKWKAFWAIAIAFTTMVMSMQMTFVALSAIAEDYGVTLRAVTWVVIAQALTISALMMPMGRFADIIGRKKVHLIGLAIFAVGSLFTAFAPTFGLLILARVVMATGNSMLQAVGTGMIISVFPDNERGKAIGSQTTAVAVGGTAACVTAVTASLAGGGSVLCARMQPRSRATSSAWLALGECRRCACPAAPSSARNSALGRQQRGSPPSPGRRQLTRQCSHCTPLSPPKQKTSIDRKESKQVTKCIPSVDENTNMFKQNVA
jgi:hypothetical protein